MKVVAHLSDPHFGTHDKHICEALVRELGDIEPAVLIVSGDLTQRARRSQYRQAKRWLESLGMPYLTVPGNHDIPLYNVFSRFFQPRKNYRELITRDLTPWFIDDTLAIVGVDTTKSFTTKHGKIERERIERAIAELDGFPGRWKILVAHHPFIVPPDSDEPPVDGAAEVLPLLEDACIDLILTGHLHLPHAAGRNDQHTIIHVQAGTCISTRTRGEPNGYNQLRFEEERVSIVHREWDGERFIDREIKVYARGDERVERLVKLAEIERHTPDDTHAH